MTDREKIHSGKVYYPSGDEIMTEQLSYLDKLYDFNMTRAMAHAGILHGAKALECYSEFNGFVDPTTGMPGRYFEEQKRLNSELKALGNTLMALTCLRVIHDDMLLPDDPSMEGLRTTMEDSELVDGALTPRLSISEHPDAHGRSG